MARAVSPLVRSLAKIACHVFYRVQRAGAPVPSGAVILLPNHANALLDPALVWASAGRDVRFLAKSTLFGTALKPLLAGAGAIPVYRRSDQGVDAARNTETFAAVGAALAAGDAVCLFPEGMSHSTGRLEPLRTGAARMAIAAERAGTRVALVPVGLNFDRKTAFRSRVTVVYGRPFSCADLLPAADDQQAAGVRALTDRMAKQMRRLLIEAEPEADARLLERVDRLYTAARGRAATPEERVARRRAIATGIQRLRAAEPQRYEDIVARIRRYDDRLRRFGLRDRHLDWRTSNTDALRFAVRETLLGLLLVPLAAIGLIVFFVPYTITGMVARRASKERDVAATATVISGAVVYGVWLAAIAAAVWLLAGKRWALIACASAPLVAAAALLAIERESAVLDAIRAWFLLRRAGGETRERLRRRRSELADVLDEVYEWLSAVNV